MAFLFFGFWAVLNGRMTAEIAVFGLVISAALYLFICRFLDYSPRYDHLLVKNLPWLGMYLAVLIREIALATFTMARYVFDHRDIPEPVLVSFHPPLRTDLARTILADSITLTPGTITVDMHDGDFQVHCYDVSLAEGIDRSVFVRLLQKLEARL